MIFLKRSKPELEKEPMFTFLSLILPEVGVLLRYYVKNPATLQSLKGVLTEIQADIGTILASLG